MRLVAFLQLYNELENGNLIRCLENCKRWADDIYIYDDCSTDGSQEVYVRYTEKKNIILGSTHDFRTELFHKQQLLDLTLGSNPQWIGWIDGDTVLCKELTQKCKEFLEEIQEYDACFLHNLNLWRHPAFYRTDSMFDDLWQLVFWKNNGQLHYEPVKGLHELQYPKGLTNTYKPRVTLPLLHYGFASVKQIVRKYLTYKSLGQQGWGLNRLVDELSSFSIHKVDKSFYPDGPPSDYDTVPFPTPMTYNKYRGFESWEEFKVSKECKELSQ